MTNHSQEPGLHDRSSGNAPDLLSQVLTMIRLRGERVYTAALRGSWGLVFQPGAAHFHLVEQGTLWLRRGGETIKVQAGDMVLLPHGSGHAICDDPATPARADASLAGFSVGEEGATTRIIGGEFHFEGAALAAVMTALPAVVHIPSEGGQAPDWLNAITHFLLKESQAMEPGSALMISRLIDLLVIRTLRTWAARQSRPVSWLGGLTEERIGRVLGAIHADPYRQWTVAGLASIAAMSRSIFAERFSSRVGEAPLQYVKRWRLTLAADMLASGTLRVKQAAERSGYGSEAAFSRAFKSQFGYAPSTLRTRSEAEKPTTVFS